MRVSVLLFAMVCACVAIGIAAPLPQDEGDVRGAFLTSRPKDKRSAREGSRKPSRRRPRPAGGTSSGATSKSPDKKPGDATDSTTSHKPGDPTKPVNMPRLGLGRTLFTGGSKWLAVGVEPEHVFEKGDRVRVLLETNTDSYLYIFNQTDEFPMIMIYPDSDL